MIKRKLPLGWKKKTILISVSKIDRMIAQGLKSKQNLKINKIFQSQLLYSLINYLRMYLGIFTIRQLLFYIL